MTTAPLLTEQDTPFSLLSFIRNTVAVLWKDWPTAMYANHLDNQNNFSLSGVCPHCKKGSVFIRASAPYIERLDSLYDLIAAAMQCQGCRKLILGITKHARASTHYAYQEHYPLGSPDDTVAEEIPEAIAADFREALRCFWIKGYNATAEMCRRAVEAACIGMGAPKNKPLETKIDYLAEKQIITPFMRDVAHKIRLGGNRAAHPDEAETPIEKDQAEAIITFARELFHHVYVVPKQLNKYDFSKPTSVTGAVATGTVPPKKP